MDIATEIERFYHQYRLYVGAGKLPEEQTLMTKAFQELSKEAQSEIMMEMMTLAMEDDARGRETIIDLQELGIEALKQLDKIEQLNKEKGS